MDNQLTPIGLYAPTNFVEQLGCIAVTDYLGFYFENANAYITYDNGVLEDELDQNSLQQHKDRCIANLFREVAQQWTDDETPYALLLNTNTLEFYKAPEEFTRNFLYDHYVRSNKLPDVMRGPVEDVAL